MSMCCNTKVAIRYLLTVLLTAGAYGYTWMEQMSPKLSLPLDGNQMLRFHVDRSEGIDHFKIVQTTADSMLIGTRNAVLNVSLSELVENEQERLKWEPTAEHHELCLVKGKSKDDCQNYIGIVVNWNGEKYVCGTNAFNPKCRLYKNDGLVEDYSGLGITPYDRHHNSTSVSSDGELYSGTASDFAGLKSLIYKHPLRTQDYDTRQLNSAHFVSSFADGEHVYFFLRETAMEQTSSGKAVFSRVARVCKKDRGGMNTPYWTTFLKARLNCSIPGDYPFYFDEIQSTSDVVEGSYGPSKEQLIYAVFSTSTNAIHGSAVCAFRLADMTAAFEGAFKQQSSYDASFLPVAARDVPAVRPGRCVDDSRALPHDTLNFSKTHPLMDQSVAPFFGQPVVTHISLTHSNRFTKVTVDPQVPTAWGQSYDVIIVATDQGKVIRMVNAGAYHSASRMDLVIIEEMQVFSKDVAITDLKMVPAGDGGQRRLIVVSDREIRSLPLGRCPTAFGCAACLALQDPYCAWDPSLSQCISSNSSRFDLMQAVADGSSDQCYGNQVFVRNPSLRPVAAASRWSSSSSRSTSSVWFILMLVLVSCCVRE